MQLKHINRKAASTLARTLLKAAKKLKIDNHFTLAKAIGVNNESVLAVLSGGRPNTRTAERYATFFDEVIGEQPKTDVVRPVIPEAAAPPKATVTAKGKPKAKRKRKAMRKAKAKTAGKPTADAQAAEPTSSMKPRRGRRPAVLPALVPGNGLGIHQQLVGLSQALGELATRLQSAHEQALEASHHATVLLGVTKTLDQDPVLKEMLNGDPATRAALGQLIKALHPSAPPALIPKAKSRTKSRTLTRKG